MWATRLIVLEVACLLEGFYPSLEAVNRGIAVDDLAGKNPVGIGGAGLLQVLTALADFAAARGGERDDGLACQVILLQESVDDAGGGVPPDGEAHIDSGVLVHVLDL